MQHNVDLKMVKTGKNPLEEKKQKRKKAPTDPAECVTVQQHPQRALQIAGNL